VLAALPASEHCGRPPSGIWLLRRWSGSC